MRKFEVAKGFENRGVILPTRATEGSAGYDIRVLTPDKKSIEIKPLEGYVFDTGIKACMGKDEVLKIYIRSSVGIKKHLILSNVVGIIDSDFYNNPENDGHIRVSVTNVSSSVQVIENNERIAQGIFVKYLTTEDDNVRVSRVGGIGSTNYEGYTEQRTA